MTISSRETSSKPAAFLYCGSPPTRSEAITTTAKQKEGQEHIMVMSKESSKRSGPASRPGHYKFQSPVIKPAPLHIHTARANPLVSLQGPKPLEKKDIFHFMKVPPELRLVIYREHLVGKSGYITLFRPLIGGFKQIMVKSGIDTTILRVSKKVYHEAKDILYKENIINIMADIHISNHPVIPRLLMPDHILSKVITMTLVCEMCNEVTRYEGQMPWRRIQDLTSLKTLRLIIVECETQKNKVQQREEMLACVLQRIPAECTLTYGSKEEMEKQFVDLVKMETNKPKRYHSYADRYEVAADVVEKAAGVALERVEKGCKSGDTQCYRFPKRGMTLTPLGGGDIDPRFVLGAGK